MKRKIDHFVLPVASLEDAAGNMANYGFIVAPEGQHPFGTANRCVYLQSGCYLELLAVTDGAAYQKAIHGDNEFIKRDHLWRQNNGDNGFSALAFASDDAYSDYACFVADDISAGNILDFSRPFILPDGNSDIASFRLAFAADDTNTDAFFFTCQRMGFPTVDRSVLENHANGVVTLKTVYMCTARPMDSLGFLQKIFQCEPSLIEPDLLCFPLANAEIRIMTAEKMVNTTHAEFNGSQKLSLLGIGFGISSREQTASYFQQNQIPYKMIKDRFLVVSNQASSSFFTFEEL